MRTSSSSLFIVASLPIVGSFVVLALATVGLGVWFTHLLAILLACGLAWVGRYTSKSGHQQITAFAIVILTLVGLAIPLLGNSPGPERWISIGPLRLYVAPLLLPSFIAAFSALVGKKSKYQTISFAAILGASVLLAIQPDASQSLGLLIASIVVFVQYRLNVSRLGIAVLPLVLGCIWAFSIPDHLVPVPYVEEVFALALSHSLLTGIVVIASATAFIAGLCIQSFNGPSWLFAIAAYYAVLFLCSTAGITPAPLVGYGAGPILGFGLMVGLLGWLEHQNLPSNN